MVQQQRMDKYLFHVFKKDAFFQAMTRFTNEDDLVLEDFERMLSFVAAYEPSTDTPYVTYLRQFSNGGKEVSYTAHLPQLQEDLLQLIQTLQFGGSFKAHFNYWDLQWKYICWRALNEVQQPYWHLGMIDFPIPGELWHYLYRNCREFEDIITSTVESSDDRIDPLFDEYGYNLVTPVSAMKILAFLNEDPELQDDTGAALTYWRSNFTGVVSGELLMLQVDHD